MSKTKTLWALEEVNLFTIICPHSYSQFKENHISKYFKKKEYIYFEEDVDKNIYLIEKGKVKIGYINENDEEVVMAILSKGDIFGEKAIFGEESRNEFAQSLENNTSVCSITQDQILDILQENKEFSVKIYKFIGFRLKKLERRLQLLLYKETKTRLLEFIKELAEDFGIKNKINNQILIKHPYTQKEIATLIGTSRPTLNILMNELKKEKIIDYLHKEITLIGIN